MKRMRLPRWAVGAGLAAVVAGSGLITAGVSAATPSGSTVDSPATFVSDLAGHLGISTATLQSALRQTELDRVQTLLSNGRISAAQAQRMDGRIQSAVVVPLWGAFTGHPGREHQVRRAPLGGVLPGAASYLGMTVAQLRADLANGQSLAAIANGVSGKSAAGLQAALLADAQGRLGSLVTQGKLSAAQEQARLTRLGQALPHLLARTGWARRGPERPMRGRDAADGNSVSGGVAAAGTGASAGSINGGAGVSGTNSGPSAVPTTGTVPGSDA